MKMSEKLNFIRGHVMGANATKPDTGVSPDETVKPSNGTGDSNMTAKAPCVEPRESKQTFQVTAAGPSAAIEASKNETRGGVKLGTGENA